MRLYGRDSGEDRKMYEFVKRLFRDHPTQVVAGLLVYLVFGSQLVQLAFGIEGGIPIHLIPRLPNLVQVMLGLSVFIVLLIGAVLSLFLGEIVSHLFSRIWKHRPRSKGIVLRSISRVFLSIILLLSLFAALAAIAYRNDELGLLAYLGTITFFMIAAAVRWNKGVIGLLTALTSVLILTGVLGFVPFVAARLLHKHCIVCPQNYASLVTTIRVNETSEQAGSAYITKLMWLEREFGDT